MDEGEALALLQGAQTIESVLAGQSGAAPSLPPAIAVVPRADAPLRAGWHDDLARLAGARPEAFAAALARGEAPLEALRSAGGLEGWAAIPDPVLPEECQA